MPTATNDGVGIAYETDGPADCEPVVLIEGLGFGRWMWRWQREGPSSIKAMAADVDAVLAYAGVERACVVGASMGGMIAQQYALDFGRADLGASLQLPPYASATGR